MASKKSAKNKHYPVVRSAPLASGAAANTVVDGARFLSVLNRRLYRMGRNYQFKVDLRPDWAGPAIEVFALRDDWAVQKAFQMAYSQYLDNTADERKRLGSHLIARWEDFRVSSGITAPSNTGLPVLLTPAGGYSSLNAGEFELSNVVDQADVKRTFTWGTPGLTQFGILQEYDKYGNAQATPDSVPSDLPYADIDSEVNEATGDDLKTDGNQPPYDQTGVASATPWVRVGVLGAGAAGQQKLSTGFFTAPCGFIFLKGFTEETEAYSIEIEAKSGDYKGVHAPSMLE